jgi:hypothetical protein
MLGVSRQRVQQLATRSVFPQPVAELARVCPDRPPSNEPSSLWAKNSNPARSLPNIVAEGTPAERMAEETPRTKG